ncbi:MAG: hypothetical protein ABSD90_14645 [Methylocystis sp.]
MSEKSMGKNKSSVDLIEPISRKTLRAYLFIPVVRHRVDGPPLLVRRLHLRRRLFLLSLLHHALSRRVGWIARFGVNRTCSKRSQGVGKALYLVNRFAFKPSSTRIRQIPFLQPKYVSLASVANRH